MTLTRFPIQEGSTVYFKDVNGQDLCGTAVGLNVSDTRDGYLCYRVMYRTEEGVYEEEWVREDHVL